MSFSAIFDMDGVIIDSEPIYMEFDTHFFENLGVKIPDELKNDFPGNSIRQIIKLVEKNIGLPYSYDETLELYNTYNLKYFKLDYNKIFNKDIIPLLKEFKKNNCKIAIASSSSKEKIETMLEECNIRDYFNLYVSGNDFKESKPNPEIYIYTANKLKTNIDKCIVFEDSIKGITAAKRAGMKIIGVRHKFLKSDLSDTDLIINNFNEINFNIVKDIIEK